MLYRGAWVATRSNPVINGFDERLLAAGTEKHVALTACMRKRLTMLNAMVKQQPTWQDRPRQAHGHSRQLLIHIRLRSGQGPPKDP